MKICYVNEIYINKLLVEFMTKTVVGTSRIVLDTKLVSVYLVLFGFQIFFLLLFLTVAKCVF